MVSSSAFRETFVLILFGIVLVPIAAKRAHDAPGYWQTFSREISSFASYSSSSDETMLWTSSLAMSLNDTIAYSPQRRSAEQRQQQHTRSKQDSASPVVRHATSSASEAEKAPMTIRFQMATSEQETSVETATTMAPGESVARATPAPAPRTAASAEPVTAEPPTTAKESDASKGRWTLIWMCSAIAAVAAFMSSC